MTVGEMLKRMTSRELVEWRALSIVRNDEAKQAELVRRVREKD